MQAHLVFPACMCDNYQNLVTRLRSSVGNVSGNRYEPDCRSSGCEFDPGPVPYFCGDLLLIMK